MNRREFSALLSLFLVSAVHSVHAKPSSEARRIGYLGSGSAESSAADVQAFQEGLKDHGWLEGRTITIEFRFAGGRGALLPGLAAELVALKVDLIVASSTPASLAAKRATATIPIVMQFVADPVGSGIVDSLSRPTGNVTGSTHMGTDLRAKYLELLKETVPKASRIAVLWKPTNPAHVGSLSALEQTARSLGVEIQFAGARTAAELDTAFDTLARQNAQALVVLPDGLFSAQGPRIVALAAQHRLPTLYGATHMVENGGLMAYGVNFPEMARRSAYFADRLLKGTLPSELPVEQPRRFELVVNVQTARRLGLTIPSTILLRADRVIE